MMIIQPNWPAPANIHAFSTTRVSWQTENMTPTSPEAREALQASFSLPAEPIWLKQTHSNIAIRASRENIDSEADASYSNQPNIPCLVFTADCLPILLCNNTGTLVAAIHAGWRGLANNIIEKTILAIQQPPNTMIAWLGPAIGPKQFEVGDDVYQAFTEKHSISSRAFTPYKEKKWLANLYELARIRLQMGGINHVYGGDFCTFSQPDLFYSYRRDKGVTGRMASLIWLT